LKCRTMAVTEHKRDKVRVVENIESRGCRTMAMTEHRRDPGESGEIANVDEKAAAGDRHPRTSPRTEFCRGALCGPTDVHWGFRPSDSQLAKFKNLAKVVAIGVALGDLRRAPAFLNKDIDNWKKRPTDKG
jgi:hypothetical protein